MHGLAHRRDRRAGQQRAEAQQQLGEPAAGLLLLQLFEPPEARLQHLGAAGEPFTRPGLGLLAAYEPDQFRGQVPRRVAVRVQLRQLLRQQVGRAVMHP